MLDSVGLDVARGVIGADVDGHTVHMVFDAHDCAIDAGRKRILAPVVVGGDMPAVWAQAHMHACSSVVCRIERAGARRVQQLAAHDAPTPQCLDGCRSGCASCLCSVAPSEPLDVCGSRIERARACRSSSSRLRTVCRRKAACTIVVACLRRARTMQRRQTCCMHVTAAERTCMCRCTSNWLGTAMAGRCLGAKLACDRGARQPCAVAAWRRVPGRGSGGKQPAPSLRPSVQAGGYSRRQRTARQSPRRSGHLPMQWLQTRQRST